MTQKARVKRVLDDGRAEVTIERTTACAHDCANCASSCSMAYTPPLTVTAENAAGAGEGDMVLLESSTKKMLSIAAVVYAVPVLLFIAGVIISSAAALRAGAAAALSVGLFAVGVVFGVIYNRRVGKKGSITYKILEILK